VNTGCPACAGHDNGESGHDGTSGGRERCARNQCFLVQLTLGAIIAHPARMFAPPPLAIAHHLIRAFAERGEGVFG